jgi:hypothetical protein
MLIKIDNARFKLLKKIAEVEKENWDKKSGEKQCKNTVKSCLTGILAEYAAKIYIYKTTNPTYLRHYGLAERITGKSFNKCDIETEIFKVEVKGVSLGQPQGQIYKYHNDKYIKNGIDYVYFVSVNVKKDDTAECIIYLIERPEKIKEWPEKPNLYGDLCLTYSPPVRT